MEKKTVNISQQLLISILFGLVSSIIIMIIGHTVQKDWNFMPETNYSGGQLSGGSISFSGGAKVSSCAYFCAFGESHLADCSNMTVYDVGKEKLPFGDVVSASFEHIPLLLIIALVISAIIYTLKKVNTTVSKEE